MWWRTFSVHRDGAQQRLHAAPEDAAQRGRRAEHGQGLRRAAGGGGDDVVVDVDDDDVVVDVDVDDVVVDDVDDDVVVDDVVVDDAQHCSC